MSSRKNRSAKIEVENFDKLRRTILKALRHSPELYGLQMDEDGWVDGLAFGELIRQFTHCDSVLDYSDMIKVVHDIDLSDRVQFKPGFIRAAYGHSTERFNPSTASIPDEPLFHGTSSDLWQFIECYGLVPGKRRFVQLTTDFDYAESIAKSLGGSPVVVQVASASAIEQGVRFYSTASHVWMASAIPSRCLQIWLTKPPSIDDDWLDSEPECNFADSTNDGSDNQYGN